MTNLYFDLIGGTSGDMTVAALLDLGVDFGELRKELAKVRIKGYVLKKRRVTRGHLKATKFDVVIRKQTNYSYPQIVRLIRTSRLSQGAKDRCLEVYKTLALAESKVHGHPQSDIHFHQVGDIDSFVDIAASCICLDRLGIKGICYSTVPLNKNIAPATAQLLLNKRIYFTSRLYENVTPTGMAILCALGKQIEPALGEFFTLGRCGYGAGSLDDPEAANVLRVAELSKAGISLQTDRIVVLAANIDDMNPQFFDYLFDKLFDAGALDFFVENVMMKKNRPGFLLTVLSNEENLGMIANLVLTQTTTLGIRFTPACRLKLSRRIEYFDFRGDKIGVKVAALPQGGQKAAPEYEDCRAAAQKHKVPIIKVYQELQQKAGKLWRSRD